MGGGGARIRRRQPTGGSGPADLGGVQWVGLGKKAPPKRTRDVGDVTVPREEPLPYCLE